MLPYYIIFLTVIVLSFYEVSLKKQINLGFYLLFFIGLAMLAGLRSEEFPDTLNYLDFFNDVDKNNFIYYFVEFESGFVVSTLVIKTIINNSLVWLCIVALLSLALKFFAIRRLSPFPFISLLVIMSGYYISLEFLQIRQGLALGFILVSLVFLVRNKFYLFYLFVIIASLFHISAFVFILARIFKNRSFHPLILLSLVLLSFVFIFVPIKDIIVWFIQKILFFNGFAYSKLMSYSEGRYAEIVGLSSIQIWYLSIVSFFLYYKRFFSKDGKYNLLLNIYVLGIIMNFTFNSFSVLLRASYYFLVVEGVLVALIINRTKYNRYITWIVVCTMGLLRYLLYLYKLELNL